MHQILITIEEKTLEKLKTNAKLEKRSTSNYLGVLIDNLFRQTDVIKTNEISCKTSYNIDNIKDNKVVEDIF
jgi:hypothetical protein